GSDSYAHPKAPKPYQTRSAKALTEEQIFALLNVVGAKARTGDLVGKRDYALLLLYITTGMRRSEVIGLKGREVVVEEKRIIIRSRVKGGDYQGREVTDGRVRAALLDYLRSSRRLHVLREDAPLWTRHDSAGEPGAQLSSWSFVENLKRYAREAGIRKIHLHQTRHCPYRKFRPAFKYLHLAFSGAMLLYPLVLSYSDLLLHVLCPASQFSST